MRPNNNPIFSLATAASSQISLAQWTDCIVRCSFQVMTTGASATGNLQVQASNELAFGLPPNQFQPTKWSNVGAPVAVAGAGTQITPVIECSYEYIRLVYTSTAAGLQTVTFVADVGGSLNNKWFNLNSGNNAGLYYVWFNINGLGVDPAIAGRTGIQVNGATGATAAALGTAASVAISAVNGGLDFSTAGTSPLTITNLVAGPFVPASDGLAPTGFTFATTALGTITARMKSMAL